MILDNFEYGYYPAPVLDVEKSVLLSWPQNTVEEQIALGAAILDGPWVPCLEPIFKRPGEVCMAVPTTSTQQYFMLAPGSQFSDDFSGDKGQWEPIFYAGDTSKTTFVQTNGTLRIKGQAGAVASRGCVVPLGPEQLHADVAMSEVLPEV